MKCVLLFEEGAVRVARVLLLLLVAGQQFRRGIISSTTGCQQSAALCTASVL